MRKPHHCPFRAKPRRVCENELFTLRAKQKTLKTLGRKKKKKRGEKEVKEALGNGQLKPTEPLMTGEKKKKRPGAEGLGCASFAQPGAGCFKGRRCPKEPEHRAGSAGGAPAPLPALIPLTTSTLRFVLNVHFYWCSPFAKMCLITQM